ncbi:FG-GAP repeat domain-containing protein [Streptomyces kanasensis]|uniref:FG-GAP repeat domain-containing protein n=1 Tax=Streptomyces kanasensis TaxID=936756 RepID=UPI00380374A1
MTGDFNGDGKTDVAVLYNNGQHADGCNESTLWTFTGNGAGFDAPVAKWNSGTTSWDWNRSKPVTGDCNGDGRTDLTVLYDNGQQTDGIHRTACGGSPAPEPDSPTPRESGTAATSPAEQAVARWGRFPRPAPSRASRAPAPLRHACPYEEAPGVPARGLRHGGAPWEDQAAADRPPSTRTTPRDLAALRACAPGKSVAGER